VTLSDNDIKSCNTKVEFFRRISVITLVPFDAGRPHLVRWNTVEERVSMGSATP